MLAVRYHRNAVWIVLALALTLRLAAALWVEHVVSQTPGRICLIPGDADGYWELGRKLAHGQSYAIYDPPRFVMRMPGFPLLLAACQLVFGDALFPTRCVLAVIGTLACGLVYWLGSELADSTVGLIAAFATAVSPALVVFSVLLLSETPFAAALVASLIPWAKLFKPRERCCWKLAAVAGVLAAVATYLRPTWLPMAPLAAAVLIISGHGHRDRWCEALVAVVVLAAAMFPWAYRNYQVTGHWITTTLWVGPSLYDGLNPQATGDSDMTFFERDQLLNRMSEYDMDREYRRRAWQFAAAHPGRAFQLGLLKAERYWSIFPNAAQFQNRWIQAAMFVTTVPLFLLALTGVVTHWADWRLWLITLSPVLFFAAVHMLFVGSIRYRLPAEYPLWIIAAAGLTGSKGMISRFVAAPPFERAGVRDLHRTTRAPCAHFFELMTDLIIKTQPCSAVHSSIISSRGIDGGAITAISRGSPSAAHPRSKSRSGPRSTPAGSQPAPLRPRWGWKINRFSAIRGCAADGDPRLMAIIPAGMKALHLNGRSLPSYGQWNSLYGPPSRPRVRASNNSPSPYLSTHRNGCPPQTGERGPEKMHRGHVCGAWDRYLVKRGN